MALDRTESGRALPPPLFFLAGTAERLQGNNANPCWRGRLVHTTITGESMPAVVKLLDSEVTLAVELACGIAAQELRLPVPAPALVIAEREDLPGLPHSVRGERLLLVGSRYKRPDALLAEVLKDNHAAEELVWQRLCSTKAGAQGAAWDELVANADRHSENVLFDGLEWWLFDHDQALPFSADYVAQLHASQARQNATQFAALANELAQQMLQRRPRDHGLMDLPKQWQPGGKRIEAVARYALRWEHPDTRIQGVLRLSGVALGLIQMRLPALAEQLQRRIGQPHSDASSLWTSPSPPR